MSEQRSESAEARSGTARRRVGKGRPPVGRPFAKGQSGNPAGRPRQRAATGAPGDRLPGADQPTRVMILEEAYRPVAVRDGEDEIELAAHRAIFRAMTTAALKGSGIAQRRWTDLVLRAELAQKLDQVLLHRVMERPYHEADREASYADEVVIDGRTGQGVVRVGVKDEEGRVKLPGGQALE